jgi:hypothetical protein
LINPSPIEDPDAGGNSEITEDLIKAGREVLYRSGRLQYEALEADDLLPSDDPSLTGHQQKALRLPASRVNKSSASLIPLAYIRLSFTVSRSVTLNMLGWRNGRNSNGAGEFTP